MKTALILFAFLASASAKADDVCAIVMKSAGSAEVQVKKGEWKKLKVESDISCGSFVSSRDGFLAVKHRDGFQIWSAHKTIFSLENSGTALKLESGQILVRGTPGQKNLVITTSRGEVKFSGGVASVTVDPKTLQTQVAVFAESVLFRNNFFPEAEVKVKASKMSVLSTIHERIAPTQPDYIDPATVRLTLVQVGLGQEEVDEFANIIAEERERQEKTFASEFSNWKSINETQDDERSLAAQPREDKKVGPKSGNKSSSVNLEEEKRARSTFTEHLLGQDSDENNNLFNPNQSRTPASVTSAKKDNSEEIDPEFQAAKKKFSREKDNVLKEISELKP